jgi:fibronectin-binding autotransporter adhesin
MNRIPPRSCRPLLGSIAALLLGATASVFSAPVPVGSATWLQNPGSSDWNTGANWNPNIQPTVTASFGTSTITTVTLSSDATINNIVFNSGASAFTISTPKDTTLIINGAGITNNSGIVQNFVAPVDSSGNYGVIYFPGSASAGSNTVYTTYGTIVNGSFGGFVEFDNNSTAGSATFINNGAAYGGNNAGGNTYFTGNSTAGERHLY